MHLCKDCSCSKVGSPSSVTVLPWKVSLDEGKPMISLQVLPKNRYTPSIPLVLHVFESLKNSEINSNIM
uniref:Uncharacterized protein n=1 Tax=Rhizophora mucronata TaxID=61149 RepID=A0A2P2MC21_RHIMU